MTFPNAYLGVKKLYIGQILELIAVILMTIAAVLALATIYAQGEASVDEIVVGGFAIGTVTAMLPAVILALIGEILTLVGLWQGGKDEPQYLKKAFWVAIIALIVSFAVSAYSSITGATEQSFIMSASSSLYSFFELLIVIFTILGVCELDKKIGRPTLVKRGNRVIIWITVVLALSIIASIASNWFGQAAAVVGLVLAIIAYFSYLNFLRRSKNSLAIR